MSRQALGKLELEWNELELEQLCYELDCITMHDIALNHV